MSVNDTEQYRTLLQSALQRIREQKLEIEHLHQSVANDQIVIIGMGCRFPGKANTPQALWDLLCNHIDPIKEIPYSRWAVEEFYDDDPSAGGKIYCRSGGFVDGDAYAFDAEFFSITKSEAKSMDPQHRLMLEVVWEALEDAGIAPSSLYGSNTGVYLGLMTQDHALMSMSSFSHIEPYTATGNGIGVCAGRISHTLGLQGPTLSIDTACSSSLVALHLASQALRNKDADMAVVGGINLILSPAMNVMMSRAGALAKDGRCKAFDAAADGYGRSEGCGAVILKRLVDAVRDGDQILAVVKGSAVNHDGHSSALPVPSGLAQQKVMHKALASANLKAEEIDYIEAHGTGTQLGDPIEIDAIHKVYGEARDHNNPIKIGTVKSNIGHTEAASGIAGVIKAVLCLKNELLPANLHFLAPSLQVPWASRNVNVVSENQSFTRKDRPLRSAISSFGFSGTNAHVVLEQPAVLLEVAEDFTNGYQILKVSAKTREALNDLIDSYRVAITDSSSLSSFCYTANTGREDFRFRAAFVFCSDDHDHLVVQMSNDNSQEQQQEQIAHPFCTLLDESDFAMLAGRISIDNWNFIAPFIEAVRLCDRIFMENYGCGLAIWSDDNRLISFTQEASEELKYFVGAYAALHAWVRLCPGPAMLLAREGQWAALSVLHPEKIKDWLGLAIGVKQEISMSDVSLKRGRLELSYRARSGEVTTGPTFTQRKQQVLSELDCKSAFRIPDFNDSAYNTGKHSGFLEVLAKHYCAGFDVDWLALYKGQRHLKSSLPTYPFQRLELRSSWAAIKTDAPAMNENGLSEGEAWAHKIDGLSDKQTEQLLCDEIIGRLVEGLGFTPEHLDVDLGLQELGVNSLFALEIRKQLNILTGVNIALTQLLDGLTIRGLARKILSAIKINAAPLHSRVELENGHLNAPLSKGQHGLWMIQEWNRNCVAYNIMVAVPLDATVDITCFRKIIIDVHRRHEALNLVFNTHGGEIFQKVEVRDPDIQMVDIESDLLLDGYLAAAADKPFDLRLEVPVRYLILKTFEGHENYFVLIAHHIAMDFWSIGVLLQELQYTYHAKELRADKASSYLGHVLEEQRWLDSTAVEASKNYWREKLKDAHVLSLPLDFSRPTIQCYEGDRVSERLPLELSEALRLHARLNGSTNFLVFLAMFNVLLSRISGQQDITIGVPVFGRENPGCEETIVHFVNALPLRLFINESVNCSEFLRVLKRVYLEALENNRLPFTDIVTAAGVEYDPSYFPLCQAMFVWHESTKTLLSNLVGSRIFADPLPISGQRGAPNDIVLEVYDDGERFNVGFNYCSRLFKKKTIERFLQYFIKLLTSVCKETDSQLQDLQVLSLAEAQVLTTQLNQTNVNYGAFQGVSQRIYRNCQAMPEQAALRFGEGLLSYGMLNLKAQQLRTGLERAGINPGCVVAMTLPRSLMLVPAVLGIFYAGAVYCPFDLQLPRQRLLQQIEDAKPLIAIIDEHTPLSDIEWLSIHGVKSIRIDVLLVEDSLSRVPADIQEDDPAYILFTSGSTGQPKGVVNRQVSLENRLLWQLNQVSLSAADVVLHKTPLTFDVSVWELLWPFLAGATLVVADVDAHKYPKCIAECIRRHAISIVHFVPSMLEVFLEAGFPQLKSIRSVIVSGEQLTITLQQRFFKIFPGCELLNLYGPTEAAIDVSCWRCDPENGAGSAVPVGFPIWNLKLYILDECLKVVPFGLKGELYIGGVGVALGYINRPELTASNFIDDPFAMKGKIYKTGDLARYNEDGSIQFLGRIDNQVKLRGQRIELGDIEAQMDSCPGVSRSVVLVKNGKAGQELCAVIVPSAFDEPVVTQYLSTLQTYPGAVQRMRYLPNGMRVLECNRQETDYIYNEIVDEQCYFRAGIAIRPGDTVVDVGANIGIFSLLAGALVGGQGHVIAYEPIPDIYDVLKFNSALYSLPIRAMQFGLSDMEAEAEFSYFPNNTLISGKAGFVETNRRTLEKIAGVDSGEGPNKHLAELLDAKLEEKRTTVRLTTISREIERLKLTRIDLLKIDAERSERDILHGISEHHWSLIKQVVVEAENDRTVIEALQRMLEDKGYSVTVEVGATPSNSSFVLLYARRPSESANQPQVISTESWPFASPQSFLEQTLQSLQQKLPAYMLPDRLYLTSSLPVSVNGKLNRQVLDEASWYACEDFADAQPLSALQYELAELWSALLDRPITHGDVNFYDLGGHSLAMARLAEQVTVRYGVKIQSLLLVQGFTIETLAELIEDEKVEIEPVRQMLSLLTTDHNNGKQIVLIPPATGSLFCYRQLIAGLGSSCTIWGGRSDFKYDSITSLAECYLESFKSLDSLRQTTLIGWSFGGVVAFEIARKLSIQGVDLNVLLIDPHLPKHFKMMSRSMLIANNVAAELGVNLTLKDLQLLTSLQDDFSADRMLSMLGASNTFDRNHAVKVLMQVQHDVKCLLEYSAIKGEFPCRIFAAADTLIDRGGYKKDWLSLNNKIEIELGSGNHFHLLNEANREKLISLL